ncbi:MAG: hypothetical protein DIU74_002000 [Pseudomonadota bacterium]|nr:MAG: hypothetical protein DIU74_04835 [Pseudomonadota bacterium]
MPDASKGAHSAVRARAWGALVFALTFGALAWLWIDRATGFPIEFDAYENLTAAYNLVHHGVMSIEDAPDAAPQPSEHREPLPILALAAYLAAIDPLLGEAPLAELASGAPARLLKYSNIPWAVLLTLVLYGSVLRWTGSHGWAAFCTLAVHAQLAYQYDFLYSEIAAAALLALSSATAALAVERRRPFYWLLAGLLFGAMALTKAAFFYVALVCIAGLILWRLWCRLRASEAVTPYAPLALVLGMGIVVAPWMLRNYIHFDTPTLSGRGGIVLLTRALKNGMSAEEYRGAWFAYAPRPLRRLTGKLTGFDDRDLKDGGRLVRLVRFASPADRPAMEQGRPEQAVSYYARANAMRTELERLHPQASEVEIDRMLKARAMALLRADPWAHVATTPLFLWRGAPYTLLILGVGLVYACYRRQAWLCVYVAPALLLLGFYGAVSHFIPRYAEPAWPVAAVVFAILAHAAWRTLRKRAGRRTRETELAQAPLMEAGR